MVLNLTSEMAAGLSALAAASRLAVEVYLRGELSKSWPACGGCRDAAAIFLMGRYRT